MAKASATAPARGSSARDRPDHLAAVASAMALWRGLFFDLPLVWAMEMSHSLGQGLEAQADHLRNLSACADIREVLDEQDRFARESIAELAEEADALAREAQIAVAAA